MGRDSEGSEPDPRGLVGESYRIEGVTEAECRSIFLDWAIAAPADPAPAIEALLDRHGAAAPDHPMTRVLREALVTPVRTGRRGGWRSRR